MFCFKQKKLLFASIDANGRQRVPASHWLGVCLSLLSLLDILLRSREIKTSLSF